jgi:hypothetical protein
VSDERTIVFFPEGRLEAISARLRAKPGRVRAADLIEQVAVTGQPVP